jgi:hypothetical protein
MGLRQEIAHAKTEQDILKLLQKANSNYTLASEKTKRAWKSTASRTIASLNKSPSLNVNKDDIKKKSSKKKANKNIS